MGDGNRVRGLPAGGVPANTTVVRTQKLIPRVEFKRGWAAIVSLAGGPDSGLDGNTPGQAQATLGIRNLTGTTAAPNSADMLVVQVRLRQMPITPGDIYMAQAPTSGAWRVGATVKRTLTGTSPILEWQCVVNGTANGAGNFIATKWMFSSGTTAQRPTGLTANDRGYAGYFNTTLGRLDVWNGTGWM